MCVDPRAWQLHRCRHLRAGIGRATDTHRQPRPGGDILPHVEDRDPWVPAGELRRILHEAPADAGLLTDLAGIREAELDDA